MSDTESVTSYETVEEVKICGFCYEPKSEINRLKKCKGCNQIRYCDVKCQKRHWKIHKAYCLGLTANQP